MAREQTIPEIEIYQISSIIPSESTHHETNLYNHHLLILIDTLIIQSGTDIYEE